MKDYLDIYYNAENLTIDMKNFMVDTVTKTITTADYFYIGYDKPINAVYFSVEQGNTNSSLLSASYWDGSQYTELVINDYTKGFSRSGHIEWAKEIEDQVKNSQNSVEKYWYRIEVSADTSEIIFNGVNMVFADDRDLLEEETDILQDPRRLPDNRSNFDNYHQAAKNHMIQDLRNSGKVKIKNDGDLLDLTIFDLHNYNQLRQAGKYLALHKLMMNLSDEPNDIYNQKAQNYLKMYGDAFNVFLLSFDIDDDGKIDRNEKNNFQVNRIVRV